MTDHQITCITKKPTHSDRHEHITHVGGAGWYITREEAIRLITNGTNRFYVYDATKNKSAWVEVVRPQGRDAYLRTDPDGDLKDNLLWLGECRA